jgi:tetratricopeptide (TPR) repeat protein/membrane protease YdiL (CAAX protease family)
MPENSPFDRPAPSDAVLTPGRGFWASVGWLLLFQVITGLAAGFAAAIFAVVGRQFPAIPLAWAGIALAPVTAILLAFVRLERSVPQALAVRRPSLLHAALVVLTIPPLVVVSSNVWGLAQRGIMVVRGAEASPQAVVPVTGAAGTLGTLEKMYEAIEAIGRKPLLVVLLLGCLCPGLAEEVFFRGFLGRGLVARFGLVWGVPLTSLLFGLMHLIPAHVCATIVMGVVLHFVYLTTKSLLAPVLLHTLNNFVVLSQWRVTQDTPFADFFGDGGVNLPLFLAALAALAGLGVVLYRTRVRWVLPDQSEWNPGYPTAETPPASRHAVPWQRSAGCRAGFAAVGTYLLFVTACALTAVYPPQSSWSCYQQGMQAYDREDFGEAIDRYCESIRLSPDYAWSYNGRGLALGRKGDHAAAIRDLTEAIRLNPIEAEFYANRAWAHSLRMEFAEAVRDAEHALELDAKCAFAAETRASACSSLGGQAYDRDRFDEAIAHFGEAIRSNPRFTNAYSGRGMSRGMKGDSAGALEDFNAAIRLDPRIAAFYANRAWAHSLRMEFAEAVRDAEHALELDAKCAFAIQMGVSVHSQLWREAEARRDSDEVIAHSTAAIRLKPDLHPAYGARAVALAIKGNHADALRDLTEAIRIHKAEAYYANRAWVHNLRRDFAAALSDSDQALAINPKYSFAHQQRATAIGGLVRHLFLMNWFLP